MDNTNRVLHSQPKKEGECLEYTLILVVICYCTPVFFCNSDVAFTLYSMLVFISQKHVGESLWLTIIEH